MRKPVILLAERDAAQRHDLKNLLFCKGCEIIEVLDSIGILRTLRQKQDLDLLIVNASLDAVGDGLEVAQQLRQWNKTLPVILMATQSSEDLAIAALKAGVADYFKPPFSYEALLASVQRCLTESWQQEVVRQPETPATSMQLNTGARLIGMIGESPRMQEIKTYLLKAAATESHTLITGETGTGKELVAELIHRNSPRRQKPLVCVNCAAIPDSLLESELFGYEKGAFTGANSSQAGKLQLAHGGSIFFDEIGDMSAFAQAKILRVIDSGEVQRLGAKNNIPVDVRIIAATNQDLEWAMSEEKFRKDLYFRLNVARVHLPPLRERKEDLPALFDYYIGEFNRRFGRAVEGFTDEALDSLLHYEWPGNVRELKNLIEAIFVNLPARKIALVDLPEQFRRRLKETAGLPRDERARLLSALFSTNWNMSQAAQKLHWSRMTLYRKMAKYHIVKGSKNTCITAMSSGKKDRNVYNGLI